LKAKPDGVHVIVAVHICSVVLSNNRSFSLTQIDTPPHFQVTTQSLLLMVEQRLPGNVDME
jgi:hypothetical protein